MENHTSQALDARCLHDQGGTSAIECNCYAESGRVAHLRKLGWPGVWELGAALVFGNDAAAPRIVAAAVCMI